MAVAKAVAKKDKTLHFYEGVGRRKEAVARVRLYIVGKDKTATIGGAKVKQGEMVLNKKPIDVLFSSMQEKTRYLAPFKLTNNEERFAVSILVRGGGRQGQLEAVIHGIARALEKSDKETLRPLLKKEGLLTRDSRVRERRKVGTGGKARRVKQSPKR
jgi:small subunit ribosomal protein S9